MEPAEITSIVLGPFSAVRPSPDHTADRRATEVVVGPSSPLPGRRDRRPVSQSEPVEVVLGPSSALPTHQPASRVVHRRSRHPRRSIGSPAYFLGRTAERWLTALAAPRPQLALAPLPAASARAVGRRVA